MSRDIQQSAVLYAAQAHMLSDAGGFIVSLVALQLSKMEATKEYTYGYKQAAPHLASFEDYLQRVAVPNSRQKFSVRSCQWPSSGH